MVEMQVREQDCRDLPDANSGLGQPHDGTAADVHQHAELAARNQCG